jgi:hypothetical protein
LKDGIVEEVGEDDRGAGVLGPEAAESRQEKRVVVPGDVVDAPQAADAVVVVRRGAGLRSMVRTAGSPARRREPRPRGR